MLAFLGIRRIYKNAAPVGIDIEKNVFHLHYIDQETGEIVNKPIKLEQFLEHFANRAQCLNEMSASHPVSQ